MIEDGMRYPFIILLTGAIIVLTMLVKAGLGRLHIPGLIGFLLLGFLIRLVDFFWGGISDGAVEIFHFLAKIGLISLLFRVGLESDLGGLLGQLRRASAVWVGDVSISALFGYLSAHFLLGLTHISSLIVAAAFTATSVGISVAVWQERDALNSSNGELLVDLAELDDISAVVLMALLFAILPTVRGESSGPLFPLVMKTAAYFLAKLIGFAAFCYMFSRYIEGFITKFLSLIHILRAHET